MRIKVIARERDQRVEPGRQKPDGECNEGGKCVRTGIEQRAVIYLQYIATAGDKGIQLGYTTEARAATGKEISLIDSRCTRVYVYTK